MNILYILISVIALILLLLLLNEKMIIKNKNKNENESKNENFIGALDSLYSNYGAQDRYLTGNRVLGICDELGCSLNPNNYFDQWNWTPWNIPTRNLNKLIFYPYAYQYFIDQMGKYYPIIVP